MQFDVGTCVEVGDDPVAWINANPGRIKSLHLKDWGKPVEGNKERGYRVLFGEGDVPWKKVLAAAESKGGAEYYLIEQEGSRYPESGNGRSAAWRITRRCGRRGGTVRLRLNSAG